MRIFDGTANVGLREKDTNKIVAVYPHKVNGHDKDIEKTVYDWFYKQSCSAEEEMKNYYVDILNEIELKTYLH